MQASIEERLQQIKERKQTMGVFLRWSGQHKQWMPFPETFNPDPVAKDDIITVTHNVLTDTFRGKNYKSHVLYSSERYECILKDVGTMLPDIVSFNQVSNTFYNMVKECEWAKQHYWVSQFIFKSSKGFGNLLLSKIKPICIEIVNVDKLPRPIPTGFFHLKDSKGDEKILTFASVHLIALSTNQKIRAEQFTGLRKALSKFDKFVDGHVFQGDMNFHSEEQNQILPQLKLTDAWLQKYDIKQQPGYTFDTRYNELINEIFWGFEGRRMRLDRILYDAPCLHVKEMKVIFDTPIFGEKKEVERNGVFKGSVSFLADQIFGKNLFREKEKYLFRSDHFGLIATLSISSDNTKA